MPCVTEPFSLVAVDLVRPLLLTERKNRYLLTAMCLAIKYPEAIALKRVDNETVAEGLMEIISRHGIPEVLLSDQGSVLTSRMTLRLCKMLDVRKIRTSP